MSPLGGDIVRSLGMPTRTRSIAEACAWLADGVARMGAGAPKSASGAR